MDDFNPVGEILDQYNCGTCPRCGEVPTCADRSGLPLPASYPGSLFDTDRGRSFEVGTPYEWAACEACKVRWPYEGYWLAIDWLPEAPLHVVENFEVVVCGSIPEWASELMDRLLGDS
jgi:hypothetical protein